MQNIVIHSDSEYQIAIDNFVCAICAENYLDKYSATISVSLMNAIEVALQSNTQVSIFADFKGEGLTISVQSGERTFNSLLPSPTGSTELSDLYLVMNSLPDQFYVSNDASSLSFFFQVQLNNQQLAASRISVLSNLDRISNDSHKHIEQTQLFLDHQLS